MCFLRPNNRSLVASCYCNGINEELCPTEAVQAISQHFIFTPIKENQTCQKLSRSPTTLLRDEGFWTTSGLSVCPISPFCRWQQGIDYLIFKHQPFWVRARKDLRLLESLPHALTIKLLLLLSAVSQGWALNTWSQNPVSCPIKTILLLPGINCSWKMERWKTRQQKSKQHF